VSITLTYSSDVEPLTTIDISFDKKKELNHWHFSDPKLGESLRVINRNYAFYIRKDDSNSWVLKNFIDNHDFSRNKVNKLLPATTNVYEGIILLDGWLEDLVKSNGFEIISINKKTNNEDVELVFRSHYESCEKNWILGGTILFSPKQYWVMKQYQINAEFFDTEKNNKKSEPYEVTATLEYQHIDDIPFPQKSHYVNIFSKTETLTLTKNYILINRTVLPQKMFDMSHYGFPEPSHPMRRGDVIRIILMVVGTILILVSLFMKFLARRMK
jgi:hypothetical protein